MGDECVRCGEKIAPADGFVVDGEGDKHWGCHFTPEVLAREEAERAAKAYYEMWTWQMRFYPRRDNGACVPR
jgi:hypothetical protein